MKTITKTQLRAYLATQYPDPSARRRSLLGWLVRYLTTQSVDDMTDHLMDITRYGCVSGVIPQLIYNYECRAFYACYTAPIWETVFSHLDTTGETFGQVIQRMNVTVSDDTSFKVALVWFAVEQTAYTLMCELLPY